MKATPKKEFTIAEISEAQTQHIAAVNYATAYHALNRLIQIVPTDKEREEWRKKLQQMH